MWQYNYDYLCHSSSHKYINKYKSKSGKTVYVYDAKYVANHPISSIDKKKLGESTRPDKYSLGTRGNKEVKNLRQKEKDKELIRTGELGKDNDLNAAQQEWQRKEQSFTRDMNASLKVRDNVMKYKQELDNLPDNARPQDIDGASRKLYSELSTLIKERNRIVKMIPRWVKENNSEEYQKLVKQIDDAFMGDKLWSEIGESFIKRGYKW